MPTTPPSHHSDSPRGGRTAVVLVAAGSGTRLGRAMPKAAVPVAGVPMLERAIASVAAALPEAQIVAVLPAGDASLWQLCASIAAAPHDDGAPRSNLVAVAGGATRNDSVRAGLAAIGDADHVLVHDAARCLTPPAVFAAVVDALTAGARAVVPALPVVDTIKAVRAAPDASIAAEAVESTPPRSGLRAVQTPQGFRRDVLVAAQRQVAAWPAARAETVTDDALLMEMLGEDVYLVPGDERALKITTELDLMLAEALIAAGEEHS
ncbi:2-C-methyl-D-erythritol 4-phosphate cytidylyltransferase [Zhihengliuella halotolerans]|uniref:2-C-methyl-D-erythritol 4-phosphate cytidylyltransferase n=1 Tax=Zhihengliuella halotolerans TaxID=370736 RepID=UPI000C805871|nr:2-C-methyl-D-erythritol 4-phosphate cytidylyltransferase [Zhihengliuella halotolerans]